MTEEKTHDIEETLDLIKKVKIAKEATTEAEEELKELEGG